MHFTRRPFAFPAELDAVLRGHFWRGEQPDAATLKPKARALMDLWPELAQGRGQKPGAKGRHYSAQRAFAEAYAAYYLPANAMKLALILEETRAFSLPLAEPGRRLRWLDVGTGPGTALWGLAWWAAHREVAFEFRGLEQSQYFISVASALGARLLRELDASGSTAQWQPFRQGGDERLATKIREYGPTVLSMLNSIGELAADLGKRAELLAEAIDALAALSRDDGEPRWLVLVEPGSKVASRELLELRKVILERPDARVWLPCLSARPCGALEKTDDWCHEEAALQFPEWMDELGSAAGLRKEAVLFSYLVVSVGSHPAEPAGWPAGGLRMVSQLLREKGLVQCFLCTASGKKRARLLHSRTNDRNEAFGSAVRGLVFSDVQLAEKGDVETFTECGVETELDPTVFPPLR